MRDRDHRPFELLQVGLKPRHRLRHNNMYLVCGHALVRGAVVTRWLRLPVHRGGWSAHRATAYHETRARASPAPRAASRLPRASPPWRRPEGSAARVRRARRCGRAPTDSQHRFSPEVGYAGRWLRGEVVTRGEAVTQRRLHKWLHMSGYT